MFVKVGTIAPRAGSEKPAINAQNKVDEDVAMARPKTKLPATTAIPAERIGRSILLIRGEKVLLDRDLADLYQVETRALIQAVKRNIGRFPTDFMFQLSTKELELWRSQFVMSNPAAKMGLRRRPYAFTEQAWRCCRASSTASGRSK